jgi:hypothetical protein
LQLKGEGEIVERFHAGAGRRLLLTICGGFFVLAFQALGQSTTTISPGMGTQDIQQALLEAQPGSTILFEPGKYQITSELTVPCSGLTITGPNTTPPTVILVATFEGHTILAFPWQCSQLGTVRYIHFQNTGAVYVGANSAGFDFENNLVTNLPSSVGGNYSVTESGVFLDGSLSPMTSTRDVTIKNNIFGDSSSCAAVFASGKDEGGYCAGVITHTGLNDGLTIANNQFIHLEEGIHLLQLATYKPGDTNSGCTACAIEYNSVVNYHRIGIEIQVHTRDTMLIRHNAVIEPLGAYYGTFAVSLACCQSGPIQGIPGFSPSLYFDDNVLTASIPGHQCPPYGVEFWGMGAQGTNNLVEGLFCNGFTWGYGSDPWSIKNNYICGPNFASGGGYVSNQQHQNNPPMQAGNLTGSKCSARASAAPAISPSGGAFVGSQTVTLVSSGPNTSIWYTTDGSVPVPGSGTARLYSQPFKIANSTVVKAVGMWGTPNQPMSYPSGYGYIPSGVVTASFETGSAVASAARTVRPHSR